MAIRPIVLAATLAVAALGTTTVTAQVYKETVSGHNGPMTVEVTIEKGAVKTVKVLKHSETVGIGSVAVEKIPAAIVKSNKADVAAVTGASVTSKAIEQAVEVALAKATGKSLKAKFKPGTYKSQAYGNNGYLNVEVTVTKDKIKSIKVPANQETPFMGGMAIKSISDDIVRYQTLNVDAVSGATVTSAAFKQAVGAALTQSGVNLAALQKPVPQKIKKFKGTRELDLITMHPYYKEKYGFVPADSVPESVSWGLEMAYEDWCISQIAKKAGNIELANEYAKKAEYYKRYLDPETKMMRPVMGDGSFRTPFNPRYSSHMKSDYTEGNAFQWSFFAPHDMDNFIAAIGGKKELETRLDTLFTTSSQIDGAEASGDITGLIGQYAHGNEPSHHMAYLYNWTDSPWKGQGYLDYIMQNFLILYTN